MDRARIRNGKFIVETKDRFDTDFKEAYAEEVAEQIERDNLLDYSSREHILQFKLDGTTAQIPQIFGTIDAQAQYNNFFVGILCFDVSELTLPNNDLAASNFKERVSEKKYVDNCVMIFFARDLDSVYTKTFIDSLKHYIRVLETNVIRR